MLIFQGVAGWKNPAIFDAMVIFVGDFVRFFQEGFLEDFCWKTHAWKGIIGETNGVPNLGESEKNPGTPPTLSISRISKGAIEKQRDSSPTVGIAKNTPPG